MRQKTRGERYLYILLCGLFSVAMFMLICNVCKYPEKYFSTWRYQLQNDIMAGDAEAIAYYNENYVSNGVYLYGENRDIINLATITDFKTTNGGVYLYTNDGNSYYIAK